MYGSIYDIYLFIYLEVAKYFRKVKNKPCKSGFEVVELERSRDWHLTVRPKQTHHFKRRSRLKHAYVAYVRVDLESLGSNKHFCSKFVRVGAKKYM